MLELVGAHHVWWLLLQAWFMIAMKDGGGGPNKSDTHNKALSVGVREVGHSCMWIERR
jgi:hypothetical protein